LAVSAVQAMSHLRRVESAANGGSMADDKQRGTPYHEMKPKQKFFFVIKLAICIITFGMAFPNVMGD
jgi:hypothetical protein